MNPPCTVSSQIDEKRIPVFMSKNLLKIGNAAYLYMVNKCFACNVFCYHEAAFLWYSQFFNSSKCHWFPVFHFHFHLPTASNRSMLKKYQKMIFFPFHFGEMNSFAVYLNVSRFCWKCQAFKSEILSLFQSLEANRQSSLNIMKNENETQQKKPSLNSYYILSGEQLGKSFVHFHLYTQQQ